MNKAHAFQRNFGNSLACLLWGDGGLGGGRPRPFWLNYPAARPEHLQLLGISIGHSIKITQKVVQATNSATLFWQSRDESFHLIAYIIPIFGSPHVSTHEHVSESGAGGDTHAVHKRIVYGCDRFRKSLRCRLFCVESLWCWQPSTFCALTTLHPGQRRLFWLGGTTLRYDCFHRNVLGSFRVLRNNFRCRLHRIGHVNGTLYGRSLSRKRLGPAKILIRKGLLVSANNLVDVSALQIR